MLAQLLKPEVQELIQTRNLRALRDVLVDWEPPEIASLIDHLPSPDDVAVFRLLPRDVATDVFEYLSTEKQEELVEALPGRKSGWPSCLMNFPTTTERPCWKSFPVP